MTHWKKTRGSNTSQNEEGMSGSSSSQDESIGGMSGSSRSGTSGSREESMRGGGNTSNRGGTEGYEGAGSGGSTRGQTGSTTDRGSFGSENLNEDDMSTTPPESTGLNASGGLSASRQGGLGDRAGKLSQEGQSGDETIPGTDRGSMSGSSSGTTGLGNEKNRGVTGSGGGVEGVSNQGDSNPDEDRSRR